MLRFLILLGLVAITLFGCIAYCYFYYQFWTHVKTDRFTSLTSFEGENIRGLFGRQILIHRNFKDHLWRVDSYAQKNNIALVVNHSYRFTDHEVSRRVVEPAALSNHHAGYAIDFNIISGGEKYFAASLRRENLKRLPQNIQNFIADIRKDKDLRWGGDFNNQDPVHIDHPVNLKNRSLWQKHRDDCIGDYSQRVPVWKFWK